MKKDSKLVILVFGICIVLLLTLKQFTNSEAYVYKDFKSVMVLPINFVFTYNRIYNEYPEEELMYTYDEIEKASDLIIKAEIIEYEQFAQEMSCAEVKVLDVYKGDVKKGDRVKFYDNLTINPAYESVLAESLYFPMRYDQEYIIFLRKSDTKQHYEYTSKYLSRYNVDGDKVIIFDSESFSSKMVYDVWYWDKEAAISTIPNEKANYERYYEPLIINRKIIGNIVYNKYGTGDRKS